MFSSSLGFFLIEMRKVELIRRAGTGVLPSLVCVNKDVGQTSSVDEMPQIHTAVHSCE
jgi:hypothetical protein